ncbi:MAG TPA: hypothetical protein DIU15_00810, partial [Deltaproteobacteria bacterium]|nr:hypothetical protein [Deltaproteobacteria bacterium]
SQVRVLPAAPLLATSPIKSLLYSADVMRIVVCNRLTEYLGVEILSALLKAAGHSVELVFEADLLSATFLGALPPSLSQRADSAGRAARR